MISWTTLSKPSFSEIFGLDFGKRCRGFAEDCVQVILSDLFGVDPIFRSHF
jgi:hypothetical protein